MYTYKGYRLIYTICFCIVGDKVLLLERVKEPYTNKWNGLGGKIESQETPSDSAIRELMEEAGLDVKKAEVTYSGIITWDTLSSNNKQGMFAYIFTFAEEALFEKVQTREGILEWKSLDWVLDKDNKEMAENVQYFLPEMLKRNTPMEFACEYLHQNNMHLLTKFTVKELNSKEIVVA